MSKKNFKKFIKEKNPRFKEAAEPTTKTIEENFIRELDNNYMEKIKTRKTTTLQEAITRIKENNVNPLHMQDTEVYAYIKEKAKAKRLETNKNQNKGGKESTEEETKN